MYWLYTNVSLMNSHTGKILSWFIVVLVKPKVICFEKYGCWSELEIVWYMYMHDAFGNVIDSNIMLKRVYKILKHNHNDMKRVAFQTMKWPCQIHVRQWSQNLEKTRSQKFVPKSVGSLWNLTGVSSWRLWRRMSKFKTIKDDVYQPIFHGIFW